MRSGKNGKPAEGQPPPPLGSNIHYSPHDHKPLCSYSSKLCRQRRLNGYGFCIRHILEDATAPFKQCFFVTRNNSQKCLNAIPLSEEREFCHSHMQVAGMIPKTERKLKPSPPTAPSKASNSKNAKGPPPPRPNKKKPPAAPAPTTTTTKTVSAPVVETELEPPNGSSSSFEQLKTLKILQKLPVRRREAWQGAGELWLGRPSIPRPAAQESRADFLARVRSCFRTEYRRVRDVVRRQEKEEVRLSVGLRESLLACVLADPSRSAHILLNGEDEVDTSKKLRLNGDPPPSKKPRPATGKKPAAPPSTTLPPAPTPVANGKKKVVKKKPPAMAPPPLSTPMEPPPPPPPLPLPEPIEVDEENVEIKVEEGLKDYTHSYLHPHLTLNATAADSSFNVLYPALMSLAGGNEPTSTTSSTATFHADFHSSPSEHPDVDFAEDLEQSFELHLDPEIAHQASRLLEENELTEEDFNELFPEARSDHKLELGLDFANNFDPADIDIDFANIFPFKTPSGDPPF